MLNTYATLATGIFDSEFASDTGVATVTQISGWFSANIGQLNAKLHTNFTGDASEMDEAAGGIYSLMYMKNFNERETRNALRGIISSQANSILSIGDNDNRVTFTNKNEVAKVFRGAANDLSAEIDNLAYNYTLYGASPRQVAGFEAGTGIYPIYNFYD